MPVGRFGRAFVALLAIYIAFGSAVPASAGYPRRIAVAPFVSLTPEDIGSTVVVLPRLVASRLMALAGADVLLLAAGGKSPEEAAREAKYPLLLRGTVARIGKAYSIDVTVTDLATGGSAGAFFTAADTIDDIIPQLGMLSGEIAEKVFGVQGAMRAVSPPPPVAAPVPVPTSPQAIGGVSPPASTQAVPAAAGAVAGAAAPATLASGWLPSSIKQVSLSDKVPDELYGVVAVDRDAEGNDLVAAYGRTAIYLYRVKEKEILPFTRYPLTLQDHILNVAAFDLDGDGVREILVTNLVGETADENIESFVLKKKGSTYEKVAGGIHYYLVVLPDWQGKPAVVGQYVGIESPFQGKFVPLRWDGKGFVPGTPLAASTDIPPLSSGILGLSSARFGKEWHLIYTDQDAYLRVVDAGGKSQDKSKNRYMESLFKSKNRYGASLDYFEWGPIIQIEGRRARFAIQHGVRLAPGVGDDPLVLIPEVKKGLLDITGGSFDSTRVVLLRWDGADFVAQAVSPENNRFLSGADFVSPAALTKGSKIIVSMIEQQGSVMTEKVSRLVLFQVE
jgi:hypothetical protein